MATRPKQPDFEEAKAALTAPRHDAVKMLDDPRFHAAVTYAVESQQEDWQNLVAIALGLRGSHGEVCRALQTLLSDIHDRLGSLATPAAVLEACLETVVVLRQRGTTCTFSIAGLNAILQRQLFASPRLAELSFRAASPEAPCVDAMLDALARFGTDAKVVVAAAGMMLVELERHTSTAAFLASSGLFLALLREARRHATNVCLARTVSDLTVSLLRINRALRDAIFAADGVQVFVDAMKLLAGDEVAAEKVSLALKMVLMDKAGLPHGDCRTSWPELAAVVVETATAFVQNATLCTQLCNLLVAQSFYSGVCRSAVANALGIQLAMRVLEAHVRVDDAVFAAATVLLNVTFDFPEVVIAKGGHVALARALHVRACLPDAGTAAPRICWALRKLASVYACKTYATGCADTVLALLRRHGCSDNDIAVKGCELLEMLMRNDAVRKGIVASVGFDEVKKTLATLVMHHGPGEHLKHIGAVFTHFEK